MRPHLNQIGNSPDWEGEEQRHIRRLRELARDRDGIYDMALDGFDPADPPVIPSHLSLNWEAEQNHYEEEMKKLAKEKNGIYSDGINKHKEMPEG